MRAEFIMVGTVLLHLFVLAARSVLCLKFLDRFSEHQLGEFVTHEDPSFLRSLLRRTPGLQQLAGGWRAGLDNRRNRFHQSSL
jgi:hypothetical protein